MCDKKKLPFKRKKKKVINQTMAPRNFKTKDHKIKNFCNIRSRRACHGKVKSRRAWRKESSQQVSVDAWQNGLSQQFSDDACDYDQTVCLNKKVLPPVSATPYQDIEVVDESKMRRAIIRYRVGRDDEDWEEVEYEQKQDVLPFFSWVLQKLSIL